MGKVKLGNIIFFKIFIVIILFEMKYYNLDISLI